VLTSTELDKLRQDFARGKNPSWDRGTFNAAFQGCQDVLDLPATGFDAASFVLVETITNSDAQAAQQGLDAGVVPAWGIGLTNEYLLNNPPTTTTRAVDANALVPLCE